MGVLHDPWHVIFHMMRGTWKKFEEAGVGVRAGGANEVFRFSCVLKVRWEMEYS